MFRKESFVSIFNPRVNAVENKSGWAPKGPPTGETGRVVTFMARAEILFLARLFITLPARSDGLIRAAIHVGVVSLEPGGTFAWVEGSDADYKVRIRSASGPNTVVDPDGLCHVCCHG